jgi:phosphoserine phosphatase
MEAAEVKENAGGVAAFFDLDGTLVAPPSLERRLFRMLRCRRAIPMKNFFLWLREAVQLSPRGVRRMLQTNKMHLRGIAADPWSSFGLNSAPTFYREGLERIAWHAGNGHRIMLLSGTLEPLAQAAARAIEAGLAKRGIISAVRAHATQLEELGGFWTGRVLGEAMSGEAKGLTVKKIAIEMKLNLAHCYGYGNSADDQWLLAAVGRPFAVNPSTDLRWFAKTLRWPLLNWAGNEEQTQSHRVRREDARKKELPGAIA